MHIKMTVKLCHGAKREVKSGKYVRAPVLVRGVWM